MHICYRYVMGALIFASTLAIYVGRINLSTAIVAMTASESSKSKQAENRTTLIDMSPLIALDVCSASSSSSSSRSHDNLDYFANKFREAEKFDWNEKMQGLILGGFFWGYFVFQIPGGRMAERFGARRLVTIGIAGTGVVNLVTPLIVRYLWIFIASRILLGAIQALVMPSAYALAAKWIPENERSTILSMTLIGAAIGTTIASTLSGYLSKHGFAGGWPSVFYVSGVICIAIGALFYLLVRDDPAHHPLISARELAYIKENVPCAPAKRNNRTKFPWTAAFTSRAIIAAAIVRLALVWCYSLVILKMPAYMQHVLAIPLEQNGLFTSAAFVSFAVSHLVSAIIADRLIESKFFGPKKTPVRKIFQTIACFGTAACIAAIPAFADCDRMRFLALLIISQATYGAEAGGELPLPADLSTEFAATIFAIGNMFGATTGFIGPYLAGMVLDAAPSYPKRQWSYIIYFTAIFNCIGGAVFAIFGTAEPQQWAQSPQTFADHHKGEEELQSNHRRDEKKNKIQC